MQYSWGNGAYWAVHKMKLKKYARPRDWSVLIKRAKKFDCRQETVDRWGGEATDKFKLEE